MPQESWSYKTDKNQAASFGQVVSKEAIIFRRFLFQLREREVVGLDSTVHIASGCAKIVQKPFTKRQFQFDLYTFIVHST